MRHRRTQARQCAVRSGIGAPSFGRAPPVPQPQPTTSRLVRLDFQPPRPSPKPTIQVHAAGQLTTRDVVTMLPFADELVAVELTGANLLRVLETGVGAWPAQEGRFLQVSGLRFAFDPRRPPGARVDPASVRVGGVALDPARRYSAVTKAYLRDGRDGFACMRAARALRVDQNAPSLATLVRHLFFRIEALNEGVARAGGGEIGEAEAGGEGGSKVAAGTVGAGARTEGEVGAGTRIEASAASGAEASVDLGMGARVHPGAGRDADREPALAIAGAGPQAEARTKAAASSTGWSAEVLMQPYEAGLEALYCFEPSTGKWGVRPTVEGRIRCKPGSLPGPGE